jgi:hypothetical protein
MTPAAASSGAGWLPVVIVLGLASVGLRAAAQASPAVRPGARGGGPGVVDRHGARRRARCSSARPRSRSR